MYFLLQDLRFGCRTLSRNRGFAAIAVAALALGIGANSAIFSVIYGVLLKPLPYRDPARLVRVYEYNPVERFQSFPLSPGNFRDYRAENRVFEDIATYVRQDQQYSGDHPERLVGVRISQGFFRAFGIKPALGREFTHEEEASGGPSTTVIISYNLWQRLLGGDPHVIGRTIRLTDSPFQIIGVMPKGYEHVSGGYRLRHGETVDVFLPFDLLGIPRPSRANHYCNTIARLKPNLRIEDAQAEMNSIATRLDSQYSDDRNWRIQLRPLQDDLVGTARPTLLILTGAVGFVLLIACVNVANLLLARASAREREMAIRAAVGATRGRLVSQMLTESFTLAAAGGVLGLLLAWWGVRTLVALGPEQVPRLRSVELNWIVVLVTLAASMLAGLAFGLAPALAASAQMQAMKRSPRARGALVAAEVALTFVLLTGAGLLLRSFLALEHVDPGFQTRGVLTMSTSLSWAKLGGARRYTAFFQRFMERLEATPGVIAAGASSNLPWTGANDNALFAIEGRPKLPGQSMNAHYLYVSPDYLRSIGVPLLTGRWLTPADHFDAPRVTLVNRTLALQYWPTVEACIGQRLFTVREGGAIDTAMTIVGVTGDIKDSPVDPLPRAAIYQAMTQNPTFLTFVTVRTAGDPASIAPAVREAASEMGNDLSVQEIRTMDRIVAGAVSTQRFALQMIGLFAMVALTLALIGTYGVMSHAVSRRVKEIAIRTALGAQRRDTLRMVMSQGARWIAAGLAIGTITAFWLTRALTGVLYQISARDPVTFGAVAVLLAAVAAAACARPAWRATSVDPVEALRE